MQVLRKGALMESIQVRTEIEQIEITLSGILPPYKADTSRKFIPGLTTAYVTVDGVELPPMSPEQYEVWKASVGAPSEPRKGEG